MFLEAIKLGWAPDSPQIGHAASVTLAKLSFVGKSQTRAVVASIKDNLDPFDVSLIDVTKLLVKYEYYGQKFDELITDLTCLGLDEFMLPPTEIVRLSRACIIDPLKSFSLFLGWCRKNSRNVWTRLSLQERVWQVL